jgi:hypothetical protein
MDMTKEKSYIGQVEGMPFRVRASKKPDKATIEALHAMVKLVYKMKVIKK